MYMNENIKLFSISYLQLCIYLHLCTGIFYHALMWKFANYFAIKTGNKKLGYCCDSRSYCMQYFNAIFIVIATSGPLNKKIRSPSVRGSKNYCGSASAIRSPYTCAAPVVAPCDRPRHHVIIDKRAVSFRLPA